VQGVAVEGCDFFMRSALAEEVVMTEMCDLLDNKYDL
jgi:hypothetical protein